MQPSAVLQHGLRSSGLLQSRRCTSRPARAQLPVGPVNAQLSSTGPSGSSPASAGAGASSSSAAHAACATPLTPSSSSSSGDSLRRSSEAIWVCRATSGGDGSTGGSSGGGGGGSSSGGGGGSGDGEDEEYLNLQQAQEMVAAKGVSLPEDLAAVAASGGLRASVLQQYAALASGGWLSGWLVRTLPAVRDRLIADRMFLFKVWAEVAIDSGCATVAELRKRGDEFWSEFEFYLSDLLVGLVLDVVLVTLIAPVAIAGRAPKAASASGLRRILGRLPSAVFEKSSLGRKFSPADRAGTYVKLGLEYSLAGITCGFIGQGIANSLMLLRRKYGGASEHDVAVPPLVRTALVWGMFMGLSSNTRYQIVFGLERVVDETIARRIPQVAYFSTLAIRFVNNVIGGENFIDMARWAGVQ